MGECWKKEGAGGISSCRRGETKVLMQLAQPPHLLLLPSAIVPVSKKDNSTRGVVPFTGKHSQGHTALCLQGLSGQLYDSWPPKAEREAGQTSQSPGIIGRRKERLGKQAASPGQQCSRQLSSSFAP